MFEEADSFADIFRNGLPYYLLFALPILIICSSNPVLASEFAVQRMSQFDVNGAPYGCRASALSLEAKSIYTWSTNRHCVVAKLQDLTIDQFNEIRQKAGGLVILLPGNLTSLNVEEKEHLNYLEKAMLAQPNYIPIYFSQYNAELEQVILDITRTTISNQKSDNNQRGSAASELFGSISANGYQVIVSGANHAVNKQSKIAIVQGELAPMQYNVKQVQNDKDSKLPLIIVTAHLNTFGLYNEHPLNADAAILLTLAETFSKLHHSPSTTPKYRLMFLLTETGAELNFQGIKRWLDENVQLQEDIISITGSLLAAKSRFNIIEENVDFVFCLDTTTTALDINMKDSLYMHVSKPPKEGSAMSNFFKLLEVSAQLNGNVSTESVHKKINFADLQLAWEHERFGMKRLPAFTLSALKSSKEPVRDTIFRDSEARILTQTRRNAKIIAEALAKHVFSIPEGLSDNIFMGATDINENTIKGYLNLKSALHNNDLKNSFEKYLKNVKVLYDKPGSRDPDFMFYEGQDAKMNVYKVKPAVFDLFLTLLICAYLAAVYGVIQYFPLAYDVVCKMSKIQATATTNGHSPNNHYNHVNNTAGERMKLKSY